MGPLARAVRKSFGLNIESSAKYVLFAGHALVLFTKSLCVRFAVRIKEFLAALLPRRFEFRRCDVPVRPAFPGNGTQVLAEIFHSRPTEEPVAVVDLVNNKTRLEDNHVGNHGIVDGIGVFGDVEIFLDHTPRVRKERPVGAHSGAIFIRQSDIVGANRDKPAIGNLELTMERNKSFSLPAILGTETSAAEDQNHWMWSLQFGQLAAFCGVVGKLIVREDGPWNDVRSHMKSYPVEKILVRRIDDVKPLITAESARGILCHASHFRPLGAIPS